jgi:hypothetical protein
MRVLNGECRCNEGYYGPREGPCQPCPPGKFAQIWGAEHCLVCAAGQYSTVTAATSSATCLVCPAGKLSDAGSASCRCAPGQYIPTFIPPTTTCTSTGAASTCCTGGIVSTSATSGKISQGIETQYPQLLDCWWTVGPSSSISVLFSRDFQVENNYDYVVLIFCTDSFCTNPESMQFAEVYFGGIGIADSPDVFADPDQLPNFDAPYTRTEGYMQIRFKSRVSPHDTQVGPFSTRGFVASWNTSTVDATCASCPLGATSPGTGDVSSCQCDIGYYMSGTTCVACTAGTYNPNFGSVLSSACLPCPVGTTSIAGQNKCSDPCAAGTYYTNIGASPCVECPAGTYSSTTGASACVACPAGTYSATTGATGATACKACPENTRSSSGATECFAFVAADGTCVKSYGPFGGKEPCTACAAGTGASCTWDAGGCNIASDCRCNIGTFGEGGGPCTPCHENSGATCTSMAHSARYCRVDKECYCNVGYAGPAFGTVCTACAAGTYKATIGNGAVCIACPADHTSPIASNSSAACVPSPCNAGYTGSNGGPCVACTAGKYKATTGSAACDTCPTDTVSAAGTTACAACAATTALIVAGGTAMCVCAKGFRPA